MVTGSGALSSGVIKPNQVLYDSGSWYCHGVTFRDIASGGLGSDRLRARAGRFVRRLLLPARRPARAHPPAPFRDGIRPGLDARRRPARRVPRQLADRGVDAAHVRQGVPPRAERRLPARHRPGRDASHAAADGQRHGDRRQRRHALPAAYRRADPLAARAGAQDVRSRGHPQGPVTAESLREVRAGMDKVTSAVGTATGSRSTACRSAARPGRPRPRAGTARTRPGSWRMRLRDHPQIAMAVFMEKSGGYGASVAGPVAQHIIGEYFGKKLPPIEPASR